MVLIYGAERWILTKADEKGIESTKQMLNVDGYAPWWYICEVRPVMAQNAVNRHEFTHTDRRAAIVMTTYPMLNPRDAPGYGYYLFFFVFPA